MHGTADSIKPRGPKVLTKTWTVKNDLNKGSAAELQPPATQPCYSGSIVESDREDYNFVPGSHPEPADDGKRKNTRARVRPTEQDREGSGFHQKRLSTLHAPPSFHSEHNHIGSFGHTSPLQNVATLPAKLLNVPDAMEGSRTLVLQKDRTVEGLLQSEITVKVSNHGGGEPAGVQSQRSAVRVVKKGRVHFANVVQRE